MIDVIRREIEEKKKKERSIKKKLLRWKRMWVIMKEWRRALVVVGPLVQARANLWSLEGERSGRQQGGLCKRVGTRFQRQAYDRHLTTIWRSSVREAACGLVWTGGPSVERRARSSTLRLSYLCSRSSFDRKSIAWREDRVTFFQRPYTYIKTRNFVSAWIDGKAEARFLIDFLGNRIRANQATCRIWSDTRMIFSRNSFTSTVVSAACGRSGIGDTRTGYFEIVLMTLSCKNWGRLIRSRIKRLSYEKSTRLEPRSEGNTKRCAIRKRWSRILDYDTDLRYGTTIF